MRIDLKFPRPYGPTSIEISRRKRPALPKVPRTRNGKLVNEVASAQPALAAAFKKQDHRKRVVSVSRRARKNLLPEARGKLVKETWRERRPTDYKKKVDLALDEIIYQRIEALSWPGEKIHCARLTTETAAHLVAHELAKDLHWRKFLRVPAGEAPELIELRYRNHRRRKLRWERQDYYKSRPSYPELILAYMELGKTFTDACLAIAEREAELDSSVRRDRRARWIATRSQLIAETHQLAVELSSRLPRLRWAIMELHPKS